MNLFFRFTEAKDWQFALAAGFTTFLFGAQIPAQAEQMTKEQVIATAEKVAISQFDASKWDFRHRSWLHGAFWIGVTELAKVSDEPKPDEALEKMARSLGVQNKGIGVLDQHRRAGHPVDPHHADDFAMGQVFLDYAVEHDDEEVAANTKKRTKEVTDYILSEKAAKDAARFDELDSHEALTWTWIDALFMAAPLHARMTEVTGDPKYLDSALLEWKRVSDNLYDTEEHLYYRDKGYLNSKSRNGHKVFWGRGNGWVMGAIANTLRYVPEDRPARAWLVVQFKEMSTQLAEIQQPDGSWSPSLLDYEHFP